MWQDFIGMYSLSKTLRFELKPTKNTKMYLEKSGMVNQDKQRHEAYKIVKKAIDVLHRRFLEESLAVVNLGAQDLNGLAGLISSNSVKKKDIDAIVKRIYISFETAYTLTNNKWQTELGLKKAFTSTSEMQLTALRAKKEDIAESLRMDVDELDATIRQFDKFASYFENYKQNRLNIYALESKATSAANRAINQNFVKFIKNRQKYLKYYIDKDILPIEYSDLFDVDKYSGYLSQSAIDNYNYRIGDLHKVINEQRQGLSKKAKGNLPFFEPLFKQILGDGTKRVLFEQIERSDDFTDLMIELQQKMSKWLVDINKHYDVYLRDITSPDQVYLNSRAINSIIYSQTNNVAAVRSNLPESFGKKLKTKDEGQIATSNFISLRIFFEAINNAQAELAESLVPGQKDKSSDAAAVVWCNFCDDLGNKIEEANKVISGFRSLKEFDKSSKDQIKLALDGFNEVYRMYTYFELRYKNDPVTTIDADQDFYQIFNSEDTPFSADKAERFSTAYDLARNWLTKKPYSLDKWKLNFDKPKLLDGWANQDGVPQYNGWVMRGNEGKLFLCISSYTNFFNWKKYPEYFSEDSQYELVVYRNFKPTSFFGSSWQGAYRESYKESKDRKSPEKLALMLDDLIKQESSKYPELLKIMGIKEYDKKVLAIVSLKVPKITFKKVSQKLLDNLHPRQEGAQQFIFEISGKDFISRNHSKKNLHTEYFVGAFEENSRIVIDGGAEVFFRPASVKQKTERKLKNSSRQVIENRRFTEDKIYLHIPVKINSISPKLQINRDYNQHVFERIKTNGVNAVIGIDRGEKHLAYVAIVDKNGKLLEEPISLNTITTYDKNKKPHTKDYFAALAQCENDRQDSRKNWDAIRKIKDLKDGYVSHCVKKIIDLMIEHDAVVVLENLNVGFKQGRSAIERSTYNQFEQALLKKLQYVVNKTKEPNEVFGSQNGVQLTPPDVSPGKISNHMGFVYYVDPSYTSAVDPITGYRQHLRIDERVKLGNFGQFVLQAFGDIRFENDNLVFEFSWQQLATVLNKLGKAKNKQKPSEYSGKEWAITANVLRTIYSKNANNQSESKTINIQDSLRILFDKYSIDMAGDIKEQLANAKLDAKFVGNFVWHFNQINKLRNTVDGEDTIISPVYPKGFDSRHNTLDGYAWNGDANGAYNIARKGSILLNKLYEAQTPKDFDCKVSRKEYDDFLASS